MENPMTHKILSFVFVTALASCVFQNQVLASDQSSAGGASKAKSGENIGVVSGASASKSTNTEAPTAPIVEAKVIPENSLSKCSAVLPAMVDSYTEKIKSQLRGEAVAQIQEFFRRAGVNLSNEQISFELSWKASENWQAKKYYEIEYFSKFLTIYIGKLSINHPAVDFQVEGNGNNSYMDMNLQYVEKKSPSQDNLGRNLPVQILSKECTLFNMTRESYLSFTITNKETGYVIGRSSIKVIDQKETVNLD
jgi:hypothetical protein